MIKAEIVADSKNAHGDRITTMVVTFPRIILAEFNTHRMFSRNSASSRAIPFEKMLKSVQENPFIPIAWQKDHKGMQGTEYITDEKKIEEIKGMWLNARDQAVSNASYLSTSDLDVTKQICNRLLEPFMWHTVVVTSTEWGNFFALRSPKYDLGDGVEHRSKKDALKYIDDNKLDKFDGIFITQMDWLLANKGQAEIHMMALSEAMWDAYKSSVPKDLKDGDWHIPFGNGIYIESKSEISSEEFSMQCAKIATARCARVSYTVVGEEGKDHKHEDDIKLHDRLAASGHWSPFEHCAKAMSHDQRIFEHSGGWSGNLKGFIQYRKTFQNENIK